MFVSLSCACMYRYDGVFVCTRVCPVCVCIAMRVCVYVHEFVLCTCVWLQGDEAHRMP